MCCTNTVLLRSRYGKSNIAMIGQGLDESVVGSGAGGAEARELGAVLAYLQREVPSLVALPPNELRSLVLQVCSCTLPRHHHLQSTLHILLF